MKQNIFKYGVIAGIIVSVLMISSVNYFSHCEGDVNWSYSMLIGYASMLLALSMVYVGIRQYRDYQNNGAISFGKAFKVGIMIVLVASTIYVVAWMICFYYFMPDFMEKYVARAIEDLHKSGATLEVIEAETKEMSKYVGWYKNPLFNALMTYSEILPVGILVTLISSFILKTKRNK